MMAVFVNIQYYMVRNIEITFKKYRNEVYDLSYSSLLVSVAATKNKN